MAQVPASDIDMLVVLRCQPSDELSLHIRSAEAALTRKYAELVREVGIGVTFLEEIEDDLDGIGCFIKHLCVCIVGQNIQETLPKFKPTRQVAKAFNGDFGKAREKYLHLMDKCPPDDLSKLGQQISRKFIRTGFSLVTARERSWTIDLTTACHAFSKYYPEKTSEMKRALEFSNQDIIAEHDILWLLTEFGSWLADEVQREFADI